MKTQPKWRLILLVLALWLLPVGLGACGEPEVTGVGAEHSEEHGAEEGEHGAEGDHGAEEGEASTSEDAEHSETEAPAAEHAE